MDGLGLKIPKISQIVALTITILILFAIVRFFAPESVKQWFRV